MPSLTIRTPDDFHLHLRDGAQMASVVADSARQFARAIIMPNLQPPVATVAQTLAYRERILKSLAGRHDFEPLMTLYLTDSTSPEEIREAAECEHVHGIKYYPAGTTTHAERGVTALDRVMPAIEAMAEVNLPLLVHGEVTDPKVDVYDRESVFMETVLAPLLESVSGLRVVFEHITTRQAAAFVSHGPDTLAATITPQHLMYNRNALFQGGLQPHRYCLPVLKGEEDRQALLRAAISGHPRIFLGTDSAPHARKAKEQDCGCAGVYSAHCALELYAQVFESAGALEKLEAFASENGAAFYRLPRNEGTVTLEKRDWRVPNSLPFGDETVVPLCAGEICHWRIQRK